MSSEAERDELLALLRPLGIVDEVIPERAAPPPPATPSFSGRQGYLTAGPVGIDVSALTGLPGGRGENVKIVDVEYSWNRSHEDLSKAALPGAVILNGTPHDPFSDSNHGTAVLGELSGDDNAFGVTGLAPDSLIGTANAASLEACATGSCWDPANAIEKARASASPGDVILIEQQTWGLGQDFVPVEWVPAVYDAIRLATQDGIIVVEAGANGGVNLDSESYGPRFPDGRPDSGAIIVGAGSGDCSASATERLWFSNYGSRVDLQGWGQCVTTTGYGDLFGDGADSRYTGAFSGTSSASPMVAAAAALYSSVHQATNGAAPSPELVRERLIATGTPQIDSSNGHIGPLPDLRAAAADFEPLAPAVVSTAP